MLGAKDLLTLASYLNVYYDSMQTMTEALAILKEIGFENIYYFEERKAHQCKLI